MLECSSHGVGNQPYIFVSVDINKLPNFDLLATLRAKHQRIIAVYIAFTYLFKNFASTALWFAFFSRYCTRLFLRYLALFRQTLLLHRAGYCFCSVQSFILSLNSDDFKDPCEEEIALHSDKIGSFVIVWRHVSNVLL